MSRLTGGLAARAYPVTSLDQEDDFGRSLGISICKGARYHHREDRRDGGQPDGEDEWIRDPASDGPSDQQAEAADESASSTA